MTTRRGRIRLYIEGDPKDLEAAAKRSDKAIGDIEAAVQRYNKESGRMASSNERVSQSNTKLAGSTRSVSRETNSLDRHLQGINIRFTSLRNAVGLIKWPGMIAGAGYAAEAVGTLSAGAVGLTSALAPLAGALVAYPAFFSAFAQGAGVASLATFGIKGALSEMSQAHVSAGESAASGGQAQEAAAEGIRSAEQQLASAQGTAKRAQNELTLAREEAVQNLRDLRNAAVDAGFGEQRAAMALHDARRELLKAENEPGQHTGGEISSLELSVKEARQGLKEAKEEKAQADEEAGKAGRQGVDRNPKVVEARRQLAESNQQVANSARALAAAEKSQGEAMAGSGAAVGGLNSKLSELPPAAQKFTKFLFGLQPKVKALQSTAAAGLLPGAEEGIKRALPLFPRLNNAVGGTADVLGHIAEKAGALIGSKGFGSDFSKIAGGNEQILRRMGNSGLDLFDALRQVLVVGQPLIQWISKSSEGMAKWVDDSAKAGRQTGTLAEFFDKTRWTLEKVGSILGNVASGFFDIGKAAYPLGRSILVALNEQAEKFSDWTSSFTGQNELREYFREAKPGIFEFGRLIKDVGGSILSLSKGKGFYELTHEIRTQLLPVVTQLLETTTKSFGPHLVAGLVQFGKLMASLGGSSGPLVVFVDSVTKLLRAGNWMVDNIPGFKTLAVTLGGMLAVSKAMKFVGMATGLSNALGLAKKLLVYVGLIDAASGAAGAGSGALGALGGKSSVKVFGPGGAVKAGGEFGEKALVNDALGIGGGAAASSILAAAALPLGAAAIGGFKILTHTGHEMGNNIVSGIAEVVGQETAPKIEKALAQKNVGKLEGVRRHIHDAIQLAIQEGADDSHLAPLRNALNAVGGQIGGITLNRTSFRRSLGDLRADVVTGIGGIKADLQKGLAQASQGWVVGTRPWRARTAEAMQAAVASIRFGMSDGQISVRHGTREIARLLEKIHIVRGDDPFGLAKAAAESFQKTNGITASGVKDWTQKLQGMPKAARESALDTNRNMLQAWAQGHPKLEKQIEALTDYERRKFGATNKQIQQSTANAMTHMAESAESGANSFAVALGGIGANLTSALTALGVTKIPRFEIRQASKTGTGVGPDHQHPDLGYAIGGFLPGSGRRDTQMVMAAPGEAFLTGHQQPEVQTALAFAKTFNVVRNGSLGELFANVTTPHYMATGGIVRPVIQGGGPAEREGEQHGINRVWKNAVKYYNAHAEPPRVHHMRTAMEHEAAKGWNYVYSGGHSGFHGPFDCSGYVSYGLHAGNFIDTPMSVQQGSGLYTLGAGGPGKWFTWGVRGTSGMSAHTMMSIKAANGKWKYFEAGGSGGGAHEDSGWDGAFQFRHMPGFSRGGMMPAKAREAVETYGQYAFDPRSPHFVGWGYSRGGRVQTFSGGGSVKGPWEGSSIDRTFPASDGYSGATLPFYVAAALGEWAGLPGVSMAQIGKSENLLHPGTDISDPAPDDPAARSFGWLAVNTAYNSVSSSAMRNPILNVLQAKKIVGGGSPNSNIWHADKYVTGYDLHYKGDPEAIARHIGGKGSSKAGGKAGGASGGSAKSERKAAIKAAHIGGGVAVEVPGLASTPLSPAAKGLPSNIQALLSTPGLTYAQKLAIGGAAGTEAGNTKQPVFDASGKEVSADSHADDINAAKFQKSLVSADQARVQKKLKQIAKELREPQTPKKRASLLAQQATLLGRLTEDTSTIEGLDQTINTPPDAPEQESQTLQEINDNLAAMLQLQKEDSDRMRAALNVSQGQYGALKQAITEVVSGGIGGKAGLGFQAPAVAGSLAGY